MPTQQKYAWMPDNILHHVSVGCCNITAVNACLQALVKFEDCKPILQKSSPEAEAALPNTEMQTKLQEVPSNAAVHQTSIDLELHQT